MGASTFNAGALCDVIEHCYDAVLRPELWPSLFQEFAEAVNATGLISFQLGADSQRNMLLCSPSLEVAVNAYVNEGWFLRNPRIIRAVRVSTPQRMISDKDLALVRDHLGTADDEWRHDFLERQGLGWFAGTDFFYNGGTDRVGISLERSGKVEPFQDGELALIHRAMTHVRRALTLAPALDDAGARGLLTGFEMSGQAAGLLDGAGRIILLNRRAENLLGKTIRLHDGFLTVNAPAIRDRFQRFIASLVRQGARCDDDPICTVVVPMPDGRPLIVRGAPIAPVGCEMFKRAKAFVTFTQAGRATHPSSDVLQEAFGLTSAETRVALAIARGQDCDDIATAGSVSISTVRTHLKAIFTKTGTRRQTALAVMIAGLGYGIDQHHADK